MRDLLLAPVSVIIPCYRCGGTIGRAIDSIAKQLLKPTEVVLVDDCSGDDTLAILYEIQRNQPQGWVKIISLSENLGPGIARNSGWNIATQPYIAFLDSDDTWHPEKIKMQYTYMKKNTDVVLCGHGHRLIDKKEMIDWDVSLEKELNIHKWQLLVSNRFITPSVMLKRDIKQRFIGQRYMEDHMLWLQIVCSGVPVMKLSSELAAIHKRPFGETGLSAQLWSMELGELQNYRILYGKKNINLCQLSVLSALSILKYIRRIFIYWGRRW